MAGSPATPVTERPAAQFLTPPPSPEPLQFPEDEGPHAVLTEWWYLTGHLQSADERRFGFEFVVFQSERFGYPVVYASHFAITDHVAQRFAWDERIDSHERPPAILPVTLRVRDWTLRLAGDQYDITAQMPGYAIQLTVQAVKPRVLESPSGFFSWAPATGSYYYSRTRLVVTGTLRDGASTLSVHGEAWMDHQWGNFIVAGPGGWNWFAVQLSDGRELMLWQTHNGHGNIVLAHGTLIDSSGSPQYLSAHDFEVIPTGTWQSPHTGATYPSGWQVNVPRAQLQLELTPVLRDQELQTVRSTGVIYWEGEVVVTGIADGVSASGLGYVELTGYISPSLLSSPTPPSAGHS